jgi:hypothetical protein
LSACSGHSGKSDARRPLAESTDSLLAVLISLAAPEDSRMAADAKLAARPEARDARLAVLEQILYAAGHSDAMRIYAMDQLAGADPARAAKSLALYLPRMDGDAAITHGCQVATRLGDPRMVDPLVRSYDRYRRDQAGGLRNAPHLTPIESLTGKAMTPALADRVLRSRDTSARVAAMDSLAALQGTDAARALLSEDRPDADAFLTDLRWYVTTFDHVPTGAQETAWARQLRRPQYAGMVERIIEVHRSLKRENDYAFAPRFAYVLSAADSLTLRMSRADLERDIGERLSAKTHVHRKASYDQAPDDKDESFAANQAALSRGDLLVIELLLNVLSDPAFRRQAHQLGLEDLSDTATEHGGLITLVHGRGGMTIYPPLYPENDQAYIAGDKLMDAVVEGLAPFHFHYHQIHNGEFAGPGIGDLAFTRNNSAHSVIITCLGAREFDVDYVTPNGAVVDLGVYQAE